MQLGSPVDLTIELELDTDGQWLGAVRELPGLIAYGGTRTGALMNAKALALHVLADCVEFGDVPPDLASVRFRTADRADALPT
jgi:predicted RNase H-like HicB family nuclease